MRIDHPPADIQEKFRQCGLILSTIIIRYRIKAADDYSNLNLSPSELTHTAFDAIRLKYHISHARGGVLRRWDYYLADDTFEQAPENTISVPWPPGYIEVSDVEKALAFELLKAVI